jgi:hypothetical protein
MAVWTWIGGIILIFGAILGWMIYKTALVEILTGFNETSTIQALTGPAKTQFNTWVTFTPLFIDLLFAGFIVTILFLMYMSMQRREKVTGQYGGYYG